MCLSDIKRVLAVAGFFVAWLAAFNAQAEVVQPLVALPSVRLDTGFEFANGGKNITWITCGSTDSSSGCYGSGSLGPYGHICAVAQANATLIIADSNPPKSGATPVPAKIYIYKQTDGDGDTVPPSTRLFKTIDTGIIPKPQAKCQLAVSNDVILFAFLGQSVTTINRKTFESSTSKQNVTGVSASATSAVINNPNSFGSIGYYGSSGGAINTVHFLTNFADGVSK